MKQFVKGQMYQLPNCVQRDDALQVMVQEKLVEAVDGMLVYCGRLDNTTDSRLFQVPSCSPPFRLPSGQEHEEESPVYAQQAFQKLCGT